MSVNEVFRGIRPVFKPPCQLDERLCGHNERVKQENHRRGSNSIPPPFGLRY
jgi:hypothetical protein